MPVEPAPSHRSLIRTAEDYARQHTHVPCEIDVNQHAVSVHDAPDLTISVRVEETIANALLNRDRTPESKRTHTSDVHAILLPAPRSGGYTLYLVRRVYTPDGREDLPASRLCIDITQSCFTGFKPPLTMLERATLRHPENFIQLLRDSTQLVILLNGNPLFVLGVLYRRQLHQTRKPRLSLLHDQLEPHSLILPP